MRLHNVKKGYFVYHKNELHRVYDIKKWLGRSVHLLRLRDLKQTLTTPNEVTLYHPQEGDAFLFDGESYTLQKNVRPQIEDLVLITKPRPDYIDHYDLNDIAKVVKVEGEDIVTYKGNGIKDREYMLMTPGKEKACRDIAYLLPTDKNKRSFFDNENINLNEQELLYGISLKPQIGDVYRHNATKQSVMIVAMNGQTVTLGDGKQINMRDLINPTSWEKL